MNDLLRSPARLVVWIARHPGRAYDRFLEGLGALAALLILFVAVGTSIDVVIRNLGLGVISWMLEASEYALALATFLGAAWVLHLGAHVRVDLVLNMVPRRVAFALELIGDVVGLAIACTLFYYAWDIADDKHSIGARIIKEFIFPEWWLFAVIEVAAVLLIVEFVLRIRRAVSGRLDQRRLEGL